MLGWGLQDTYFKFLIGRLVLWEVSAEKGECFPTLLCLILHAHERMFGSDFAIDNYIPTMILEQFSLITLF